MLPSLSRIYYRRSPSWRAYRDVSPHDANRFLAIPQTWSISVLLNRTYVKVAELTLDGIKIKKKKVSFAYNSLCKRTDLLKIEFLPIYSTIFSKTVCKKKNRRCIIYRNWVVFVKLQLYLIIGNFNGTQLRNYPAPCIVYYSTSTRHVRVIER